MLVKLLQIVSHVLEQRFLSALKSIRPFMAVNTCADFYFTKTPSCDLRSNKVKHETVNSLAETVVQKLEKRGPDTEQFTVMSLVVSVSTPEVACRARC